MKLLSYRSQGTSSWGALTEGGVVDLGARTGRRTLCDALEADALPRLQRLLRETPADVGLDDIEFLPVIENPPKILCIGTNYHDHRIETGREIPENPVVFARFANSQVGHGQPLVR
ncbi:UNVERIFIED_CONTAM: 5-carboxymethyl-2-hydroxymuconate isomerase, partial [Bacteroidetes bacterium 56_B9]